MEGERPISQQHARRLIAALTHIMEEVTQVLGMTFYQFASWREATTLLHEIEYGPTAAQPRIELPPPPPAPLRPRVTPRYNRPRMSLSPLIKFGTSTWTYEGWQGQVYKRIYPKGRFKQDCLSEYCQYAPQSEPLFRTVGLDATFYRPPTDQQLQHYAAQLPAGFEMLSKVWERITVPQFPLLPEYGSKAGQVNPDFLNVDLFLNDVLLPYQRSFQGHTGPFIFEFQRTQMPSDFLKRLGDFLSKLPQEFRYSVEIRNPAILSYEYRALLQQYNVSHVFNHQSYQLPLIEQHKRLGEVFSAPFVVFRLLTPLRVSYAQAVRIAEPYNKIVAELPKMRQDIITLVKQAVAEQRQTYVLVNNRAEGNAPMTIQALSDQLRVDAH